MILYSCTFKVATNFDDRQQQNSTASKNFIASRKEKETLPPQKDSVCKAYIAYPSIG